MLYYIGTVQTLTIVFIAILFPIKDFIKKSYGANWKTLENIYFWC
ncbi:hypothetical protein [Ureibacillus thermosphaericus]|uniref:Uncharacterized protein n=1 Tax=Ureibacillus thermosphaericus TaxID=51173 RepID=A0A840PUR4_URETH|nr:hypothetical protein [Ureibacillus thermosphaericus]MBB5149673.1 hypothetical protein [Ureibacillus thermosphaericus]